MRRFVNINCTCALMLCVVSLAISVYPGALQQLLLLLLLLSIVAVPVWMGWFVVCIIRARRPSAEPVPSISWLRIVVTGLILIVVYVTLKLYIPRRLVFPMNQSAFAAHVASAPESTLGGEPFGQWLGIYYVDAYAKDPRGGIYFRTGKLASLFDTVSWGFVYQPNTHGSPFGYNRYRIHPLGSGWYWFTVSDDF